MVLWKQFIILFGGFIDVGVKSLPMLLIRELWTWLTVCSELSVGSVGLRHRGVQVEADRVYRQGPSAKDGITACLRQLFMLTRLVTGHGADSLSSLVRKAPSSMAGIGRST